MILGRIGALPRGDRHLQAPRGDRPRRADGEHQPVALLHEDRRQGARRRSRGRQGDAEEHGSQRRAFGRRAKPWRRRNQAEQGYARTPCARSEMFAQVLEIDPESMVSLCSAWATRSRCSRLDERRRHRTLRRRHSRGCSGTTRRSTLRTARVLEQLDRSGEAESVYRAGMEVASRKGDLMPLKEMEHRALLLVRPARPLRTHRPRNG